jgi:DNA-binding response OmpR family regulator
MTERASILVVEDDEAIRAMLDRGLRAAGHRPRFAASIAEARRLWHEEPPTVVLLDVMLPDGDGLELLAERRRAGDRTPAALLTAREEGDLAAQAAEVDAVLLAKPFAYAELLARIEQLLAVTPRSAGDAVSRG